MKNNTSPTSDTSENWAEAYGSEVEPWEIVLAVAGYTDENIERLRPPNATPVPDAAMAYAVLLRWKIFPVPPGEKKSHVGKEMKFGSGENWGMTCDLELIRKYWKRWPQANVGLPTGWVNRIVVIETDKPGEDHKNLKADGEESLKAVEARLGPLPDTLTAESPSGSRHRYFSHPGASYKVMNSASEIGDGIDVRGDGGMVVAPPSIRKDGVYKWHNDLPIAPLPERWIKELTEERTGPARTPLPADANWAESYGAGDDDEPPTLDELKAALDDIPNNDLGWEQWNDVAMRLFPAAVALNKIEEVYKLFEDWSRTSTKKFNRSLTRQKWRKLRSNPPTRYGVRAIFNWGEQVAEDEAALQSPVDPVDLWAQSRTPQLPKGLLPKVIEQFAFLQGKLMGADPAGLAMAALTVCTAVIPDRIQLQPKKNDGGWVISTRMWNALVGGVSAMKSPIIKQCMRPINQIDADLRRMHAKAMTKYEALDKEEQKVTEKPVLQRIRIEDVTPESAQDIFKDNHNGILLSRDELSGWFGAMDKYAGHKGASADRGFWLQAFNGGEYSVDRISAGRSGLIENLSVSILGGIQPDTARKVFADGVDDGLMQRINPIMVRNRVLGSEEEASPAEPYEELVKRLFDLRCVHGLDPVCFTDDAGVIRRQLEEKHLKLVSTFEIVNKKLAAHIGKYDGMFASFCLLWHTIERHEDKLPSNIDEDTARRVASFMHDFLLPHAIAYYRNTFGLSNDHERLTAVAGYILAHDLERLTNRDIQKGVRTLRDCDRRDIESVCNQLDTFGWVTRVPGRRFTDSPTWVVNPAVHEKFKEHKEWEVDHRQQLQLLMAETIAQHEVGVKEIAVHPSGYVLSVHPGKLTPPWLQLKLVRPGPIKKRLGERSRVWLKWNSETRELDASTKLDSEPADIQDWLANVLRGELMHAP